MLKNRNKLARSFSISPSSSILRKSLIYSYKYSKLPSKKRFGYLSKTKKIEREKGRRGEGEESTYARIFDSLVLVSLYIEDSIVSL